MLKIKLIKGNALITITSGIIVDAAIAINDERIIDFGTYDELRAKYANVEVIDVGNRVLMPALVNAHTHISLSNAGSVNTGKKFPGWLFDLVTYRKTHTDENENKASVDGLKELLKSGTTTIGDLNPSLIPFKTALRNNFRGLFFSEVFGLGTKIQFLGILKYKRNLAEGRSLETSHCRIGISPHTPYTVTPRVLRFASDYARNNKMIASMHIAESEGELEFMKSRKGIYRETFAKDEHRIPITNLSPLRYVDSYGIVNDKFIVAHGVHLVDDEFELLAERGASLVTCPSSNHNVQAGHLDIAKPLNAGVILCIGTDSPASGDGYDLFHELRLALKHGEDDQVKMNPRKALSMITLNPSKILGFADDVGSIEKGKSADIIAIDIPASLDIIKDDLESAIIEHGGNDSISMTMASGKIRYSTIPEIPVSDPVK